MNVKSNSVRRHHSLFTRLARALKEADVPHPEVKEVEADEIAEVHEIMERTRTPPEFR